MKHFFLFQIHKITLFEECLACLQLLKSPSFCHCTQCCSSNCWGECMCAVCHGNIHLQQLPALYTGSGYGLGDALSVVFSSVIFYFTSVIKKQSWSGFCGCQSWDAAEALLTREHEWELNIWKDSRTDVRIHSCSVATFQWRPVSPNLCPFKAMFQLFMDIGFFGLISKKNILIFIFLFILVRGVIWLILCSKFLS